jgi:hypothetical protein
VAEAARVNGMLLREQAVHGAVLVILVDRLPLSHAVV